MQESAPGDLPKSPLREHFLAPRNVGELPAPRGHGRAENAACGDDLELFVRTEGEVLSDLRFRARACSSVIAAASLATEALRGQALSAARDTDLAALFRAAGGEERRMHAPRLVARALERALEDCARRCQA